MPTHRKITRAEADAQIAELATAAREADKTRFEQQLALGALVVRLQGLYELCDELGDDRSIKDVIEDDFEVDYSRGVQFAQFHRVDQALREAKIDRLVRESYARVVAPLLDRPKLMKRVVLRGRALAGKEGKALTAKHIKAARWEIDRENCPASFAPQEAREPGGDDAPADIETRQAPPQDSLAAFYEPNPVEGPWPYSPEARDAFVSVPSVDRHSVMEALAVAALTEDVTAETVAEAALVVRAERAEDGGRSGRAVVGVAVTVVELSRRKLLFDDHPELIEDIDILTDADVSIVEATENVDGGSAAGDGSDYIPDGARPPLLVVIPTGLCPDTLLDAHGAHGLAVGRAEVIVELGELATFGGPVILDDDGEPVLDEHGGAVLDVQAIREAARTAGIRKTFNRTGELVGWARFSTNASTGCTHRCGRRYCYASDLALKFYPQAFAPCIHPARLDAFGNQSVPDPDRFHEWEKEWSHSVFYGSMTDHLNRAFPDWWIQAVIDEIGAHPEWHVYLLTQLGVRLGDFVWPPNAMVGVTVTTQAEVRAAARTLRSVRGGGGL